MDRENERYVNTPVEAEVYEALAEQAKENGRVVGRELAWIARRALAKRIAERRAAAERLGGTRPTEQGTRPAEQGTGAGETEGEGGAE